MKNRKNWGRMWFQMFKNITKPQKLKFGPKKQQTLIKLNGSWEMKKFTHLRTQYIRKYYQDP